MDILSLYYKFFEFEYLCKFLMYCYKDFCDILLSVFPMLPKALAMCLWQQNFQRHWETYTKTRNCTENFILMKNKGVKSSKKRGRVGVRAKETFQRSLLLSKHGWGI